MEIEHLQQAANYIKSQFTDASVFENAVGVVLGSGLGDFPKILDNTTVIEYEQIPHMPRVTVQSHHGQLICGRIVEQEKSSPLILCFSGRVHSYEGIPWQHVCFQVRLLATLGVKVCCFVDVSQSSHSHTFTVIYCDKCNRRNVGWNGTWMFVSID
jgi:purine-nucleoside phosphorylase